MIHINLHGKPMMVAEGTQIKDLIPYTNFKNLVCGAFVNHEIKSLKYTIEQNAQIELFDVTHEVGQRIYESTLLLIFSKSAYIAFPNKNVEMRYSLGGGVYCEFEDGSVMSDADVAKIKSLMEEIIGDGTEILKHKIPMKKAMEIAKNYCCVTSTDLLKYAAVDYISLYEIKGFFGYYYTKTLSNTKEIYAFDLVPCAPGCVLLGVDRRDPTKAKAYVDQPNLHAELQSYEQWCKKLDVSDVPSLNEKIENGSITNLITIAEARHEQLINKMAEEIYRDHEQKRIVLIAGPSSSGKTTTSKRLRTHLTAMGLNPIAIGLDDYFVDREKTPKDEFGNYDFECLEAIDIDLFNENLIALMEGKEVEVPVFDFKTGKRLPHGRIAKVEEGSPIIIEGIHGLNERLTVHIPKENKYKIYINDLTHLNIDNNNRIPTSDVRLIRRIVRDSIQRGHDALATITMWQSVRRGEEKNIFPYSGEADFVFNSSLLYEMSVLKKYAQPPLEAISQDNTYYYEAKRILDFLSFFLPLEDESPIYTNSLLREFIGGNVFDKL